MYYLQIFHTYNRGKFIAFIETRQFEEYGIVWAVKRPQIQGAIEFVHKIIEIKIIKYLMENNINYWILFKFFSSKILLYHPQFY
jgi:hypothetical protein